VRFGFVGPTYTPDSPSADLQRTVNYYPEIVESRAGKGPISMLPTPGLKALWDLPEGPIRGMHSEAAAKLVNDRVFAAAGTRFYEIFNTLDPVTGFNTFTDHGFIGNIEGDKRVHIVSNRFELFIVSDACGYIFDLRDNTLSFVTQIEKPDSAQFLDGHFVAHQRGTQLFFISALFDGKKWNALDFGSAEAAPDDIVQIVSDHDELWIMGSLSIQVYANTGNFQFPFERIPGARFEQGIWAKETASQLDNGVFWLGGDDRGKDVFWRADGYRAQRISDHSIESAMSKMPTTQDAIAWPQLEKGHPFYWAYFPLADQTWVYDVSINMWHERGCWNTDEAIYQAHHARNHTFGFGMHLVGDRGGDCCTGAGSGVITPPDPEDLQLGISALVPLRTHVANIFLLDDFNSVYTNQPMVFDPAIYNGVVGIDFHITAEYQSGALAGQYQIVDSTGKVWAEATYDPDDNIGNPIIRTVPFSEIPTVRTPLFVKTTRPTGSTAFMNSYDLQIVLHLEDCTKFQIEWPLVSGDQSTGGGVSDNERFSYCEDFQGGGHSGAFEHYNDGTKRAYHSTRYLLERDKLGNIPANGWTLEISIQLNDSERASGDPLAPGIDPTTDFFMEAVLWDVDANTEVTGTKIRVDYADAADAAIMRANYVLGTDPSDTNGDIIKSVSWSDGLLGFTPGNQYEIRWKPSLATDARSNRAFCKIFYATLKYKIDASAEGSSSAAQIPLRVGNEIKGNHSGAGGPGSTLWNDDVRWFHRPALFLDDTKFYMEGIGMETGGTAEQRLNTHGLSDQGTSTVGGHPSANAIITGTEYDPDVPTPKQLSGEWVRPENIEDGPIAGAEPGVSVQMLEEGVDNHILEGKNFRQWIDGQNENIPFNEALLPIVEPINTVEIGLTFAITVPRTPILTEAYFPGTSVGEIVTLQVGTASVLLAAGNTEVSIYPRLAGTDHPSPLIITSQPGQTLVGLLPNQFIIIYSGFSANFTRPGGGSWVPADFTDADFSIRIKVDQILTTPVEVRIEHCVVTIGYGVDVPNAALNYSIAAIERQRTADLSLDLVPLHRVHVRYSTAVGNEIRDHGTVNLIAEVPDS